MEVSIIALSRDPRASHAVWLAYLGMVVMGQGEKALVKIDTMNETLEVMHGEVLEGVGVDVDQAVVVVTIGMTKMMTLLSAAMLADVADPGAGVDEAAEMTTSRNGGVSSGFSR